MSKKFLGIAGAVATGIALAVPSGAQAGPTGCSMTIPLDLRPLANIVIHTCEAANAPQCATPNTYYIPLDPITRIRIDLCPV
jgi:hypothetical protein